jgi:hypothetical protein
MVGESGDDMTLSSGAELAGDPVQAYNEVLAALARKRGECVAAIQRIDLAREEVKRTFRAALQAAVGAIDWPKLGPPDLGNLDVPPPSEPSATAEEDMEIPRHRPPRPVAPSVPMPQPGARPYKRKPAAQAEAMPPTSRHEHEAVPSVREGKPRAGCTVAHGALVDILRPAIYDIVRDRPGLLRTELVDEVRSRYPKLPGEGSTRVDARNRIQGIITGMIAKNQLRSATAKDGNAMYLGKAAPAAVRARTPSAPRSSPSLRTANGE